MKPFWLFKKIKNKCPVWQVLERLFNSAILTPTHSLVLTLILHKSHTELHWVWDSLLSRHHQTYFGQPPSHHPLLLCTTPLILSGMPQALKHPLSLVPFCFHLCFIYKDYLFIFIRTCQTYDYGYQSFVWQLTIAKCPLGNTLTKGYSSHRGYAQKWSVWRRSGVPRHWLDTNGGKRKTTVLCSAEQWNRWAASDFLSQSFL